METVLPPTESYPWPRKAPVARDTVRIVTREGIYWFHIIYKNRIRKLQGGEHKDRNITVKQCNGVEKENKTKQFTVHSKVDYHSLRSEK